MLWLCLCAWVAQVFVVVLKMEAVRVAIAGDRVKLQGEVLHGIRVVKFYGGLDLAVLCGVVLQYPVLVR